MKTLLIAMTSPGSKRISKLANLPYTKICILHDEEKNPQIKNRKVEFFPVKNHRSIIKTIDEIYKNFGEYRILPEFISDKNSKYAIKIFNTTFGTKIDKNIFKEKDDMQKFLGEISEKKFITKSYKEVLETEYEEIEKKLGKKCIIKPLNASSSISTFKIQSEEDFLGIKRKLAHSYNYIIEEYIGGELYSVDFFFDGENMYLLSYVREVAMIELAEKQKFSQKFLEKYGEEMERHFNFILPLAYLIDTTKISKIEFQFFEKIRQKLSHIQYHGVIHMEYKFEKETKKIGFLEWGARYGGRRKTFIKEMYNTVTEKLQYDILIAKDSAKFQKIMPGIYHFKEKEHDTNIVRIKTNFIETISFSKILKKTGDMYSISFEKFLKQYFREKFKIRIGTIDFFVKFSKNYNFFPFYKGSDTKFDYLIELDNENFELFKKKKFKIIEEIFFHDYR